VKTRFIALVSVLALSGAWVVAQESLPAGGPAEPGAGAPAAAAGQGTPAQGAPAVEAPPTDARHYSYALGLDLGMSFRGDKLPLDVESLVAGVQDGLEGKDPRYSMELCQLAIERLTQERMAIIQRADKQYLIDNAKAQGVQTTPSGLQYKVIKSGDGPMPTAEDRVQVHYRGQLVDGTVFDQTYGREPAVLELSGPRGVIPGWREALEQMKVGSKWQLAIPGNLGYGEQGRGPIPPNATLIYEVELLGIQPKVALPK
jgi:FKBP-type peptidyl-prolyl cis-trans isomerase